MLLFMCDHKVVSSCVTSGEDDVTWLAYRCGKLSEIAASVCDDNDTTPQSSTNLIVPCASVAWGVIPLSHCVAWRHRNDPSARVAGVAVLLNKHTPSGDIAAASDNLFTYLYTNGTINING